MSECSKPMPLKGQGSAEALGEVCAPAVHALIFAGSGGLRRPSLRLLLGELSAYLFDPLPPPPGPDVPRGDGHPVLVFPPFLHTDAMTRPLRFYLTALGYRVHGWGVGRLLAPSDAVLAKSAEMVASLCRRHAEKVSLVGISLGGILAREAARRQPACVRQVVTLCSPFRLPTASNLELPFRLATAQHAGAFQHLLPSLALPPPVPTSAIFTQRDGIVAWESCLNDESAFAENIEVEGAHSTISRNPQALAILADRLAQMRGTWRKFRAPQRRTSRGESGAKP
jgi:pimeloyl-ACP methyl ester carboxylesterase